MEHFVIKWKGEDCWDVIPFSEAYTCDEKKQVDVNGTVGTEVQVKFEGEMEFFTSEIYQFKKFNENAQDNCAFHVYLKNCVWNLGFFQ